MFQRNERAYSCSVNRLVSPGSSRSRRRRHHRARLRRLRLRPHFGELGGMSPCRDLRGGIGRLESRHEAVSDLPGGLQHSVLW